MSVTPRARSATDIDMLLMHTPEGANEAGVLSVLSGSRASFDFYLPPSGRLYRCNDWSRYIAWQAGDWPINQRSVGIEQWDYAARMGAAPPEHYDRLALVTAWLCSQTSIPPRHATTYGEPGIVAHAVITPDDRTDPGPGFDWEQLISKTTRVLSGSNVGGGTVANNIELVPRARGLLAVLTGAPDITVRTQPWIGSGNEEGVYPDGTQVRVMAKHVRDNGEVWYVVRGETRRFVGYVHESLIRGA